MNDNTNVLISKNGSPYARKFPFFKNELILKGRFSLSEVVYAVHDPECRGQWDFGFAEFRLIEAVTPHLTLLYLRIASPFPGSEDRDFYEKKFLFSVNNKVYLYNTALSDDLYPVDKDYPVTRGVTVIGYQCFERVAEDSIKITFLTQCDVKRGMAVTFSRKTIPGKFDEWGRELQAYLIKN